MSLSLLFLGGGSGCSGARGVTQHEMKNLDNKSERSNTLIATLVLFNERNRHTVSLCIHYPNEWNAIIVWRLHTLNKTSAEVDMLDYILACDIVIN